MAGNDSQKALLPALLFIFLAMLAVMFLFELAKQTINPGITTWESHVITIVFTSVLALVLVYFPLRSLHREHEKTAEALRLRQETEEKLQNTEAQYRSFVESVEDSIYTVDRDCRYLLINKRHLDRRGLSVRDLHRQNLREFPYPCRDPNLRGTGPAGCREQKPGAGRIRQEREIFPPESLPGHRSRFRQRDRGHGDLVRYHRPQKSRRGTGTGKQETPPPLGHHPARHEQPAPDASFLSRPFGCVPFRSVADGGVHRSGSRRSQRPLPSRSRLRKTTRSWESRLPHGRTSAHW